MLPVEKSAKKLLKKQKRDKYVILPFTVNSIFLAPVTPYLIHNLLAEGHAVLLSVRKVQPISVCSN